MRPTTIFAALTAASFLATAATAGPINYVGALVDTGSSWRTPSVANNVFALSPTGILGVDGYHLPGNQGVSHQASYVSDYQGAAFVYGGNGGYASVDNPTPTPGAAPSQLTTGTFNPFPGTGSSAETFLFSLSSTAPTRVRVGLLVDNTDVNIFNSSAVQISGPDGLSLKVDLTGESFNNRAADWVYFDILGGAGGTFSVLGFGGQAGCACLGGVSFDSVVPEPATWLLMVAGFGLIGSAIRRQSRQTAAAV
jgi:hypothetical protein